jgi:hypothetical protein
MDASSRHHFYGGMGKIIAPLLLICYHDAGASAQVLDLRGGGLLVP